MKIEEMTDAQIADYLRKFLEIKGSYKVYDRILEKCTAFNFDWESRRAKLYETEMKELFRLPGVR